MIKQPFWGKSLLIRQWRKKIRNRDRFKWVQIFHTEKACARHLYIPLCQFLKRGTDKKSRIKCQRCSLVHWLDGRNSAVLDTALRTWRANGNFFWSWLELLFRWCENGDFLTFTGKAYDAKTHQLPDNMRPESSRTVSGYIKTWPRNVQKIFRKKCNYVTSTEDIIFF